MSIDIYVIDGFYGIKLKYIFCCRMFVVVKKFVIKLGNRICRIVKIKIKRKNIIDLIDEECCCIYVYS